MATAIHTHAKSAKSLYSTQLARLVSKAEDESALLEHMREYVRKRIDIERDACERLDKLARHYSKVVLKAAGTVPDNASIASGGGANPFTSAKPTVRVFAALVSEAEQRAKRGLELFDELTANTVEPIKEYGKVRGINTAKTAEAFKQTQEEVTTAIQVLDERRKEYEDVAKQHDVAEKKHTDAIAGKSGMLTSMKQALSSVSDEERAAKLAAKLRAAQQRRSEARNAYLLALEGSNAVQQKYWLEELPSLMNRFDGDYHQQFSDATRRPAEAEVQTLDAAATGLRRVIEKAPTISQDEEKRAFQAENDKIFPGPSVFAFEPSGGDSALSLDVEGDLAVALGKQLAELMRERQATFKEHEKAVKEISGLQHMAKVYEKNPEFGNATNPLDTKTNLEMQVVTLGLKLARLEAQIGLLEKNNVTISSIQSVEITSVTMNDSTIGSTASDTRPDSRTVSFPSNSTTGLGQKRAAVLYAYAAQEPIELSIEPGQEVTVMEDARDGWTKVLLNGQVGFVPADYISKVADFKVSTGSLAGVNTPPPAYQSNPHLAANIAKGAAVAAAAAGGSDSKVLKVVVALFDYAAQESGEISFKSGDAIEVLEMPSGEWWCGRVKGSGDSGLFPSVFTHQSGQVGSSGQTSASTARGPAPAPRPVTMVVGANSLPGSALEQRRISVAAGGAPAAATARPTTAVNDAVRAQFEYIAACEGELTMQPGDIVQVMSRSTGSDAWWEGRNTRTGKVGQFPKDYTAAV